MTGVASRVGLNVRLMLAHRSCAIVATGATACYPTMIERDGLPGGLGCMAGIASGICLQMIAVFARRSRAIMTAGARASYAAMVERNGLPVCL